MENGFESGEGRKTRNYSQVSGAKIQI